MVHIYGYDINFLCMHNFSWSFTSEKLLHLSQTAVRSIDQIDLLREQKKIVSEEVALHSSALKYLSEEAVEKPKDGKIHVRCYFIFPSSRLPVYKYL